MGRAVEVTWLKKDFQEVKRVSRHRWAWLAWLRVFATFYFHGKGQDGEVPVRWQFVERAQ